MVRVLLKLVENESMQYGEDDIDCENTLAYTIMIRSMLPLSVLEKIDAYQHDDVDIVILSDE